MTTNTKNITIVGGGIAGMQMAAKLANFGFSITILEKESVLGGRVATWANIFPQNTRGSELTDEMISHITKKNISIQLSTEYQQHNIKKNNIDIVTNRGVLENQQAIIMATGFQSFDPTIKEELGYGIFNNVITSTQLETVISNNNLTRYAKNESDLRIAFVHCVGSRDRQIERNHCSKICCMIGVKQAVEIKKRFPQSHISNFYMDLRMFDEGFEELYYEAQSCHKINFVRGRVSEISEDINNKLIVKAEDTLIRKPLVGTFDLVVLLTGHEKAEFQNEAPVFYTKSSLTSTTINEAIAEANSLVLQIADYFKMLQN